MSSKARRRDVRATSPAAAADRQHSAPRPKGRRLRRRSWTPWWVGGLLVVLSLGVLVLLLRSAGGAPARSPAPTPAAVGAVAPDASFTRTDGKPVWDVDVKHVFHWMREALLR